MSQPLPERYVHSLHKGPTGRVSALAVRPRRREPVELVDAWDLDSSADHARSPKRAVTLIQEEHIAVIAALAGVDFDWHLLRRNVLVRGLNLQSLVGRRFAVGEAVLEGTELCEPCAHMEAIVGPGAIAAMTGHGGICAAIVESGTLRAGDEVLPLR